MTPKKLLRVFLIILLVIGLPFAIIHLLAAPDDAPISGSQHVAAAAANFCGPWSGPLVRLVDFPNAGLRSFNPLVALGLTLLGALLLALVPYVHKKFAQVALATGWTLFLLVWFVVGFAQIADGLL